MADQFSRESNNQEVLQQKLDEINWRITQLQAQHEVQLKNLQFQQNQELQPLYDLYETTLEQITMLQNNQSDQCAEKQVFQLDHQIALQPQQKQQNIQQQQIKQQSVGEKIWKLQQAYVDLTNNNNLPRSVSTSRINKSIKRQKNSQKQRSQSSGQIKQQLLQLLFSPQLLVNPIQSSQRTQLPIQQQININNNQQQQKIQIKHHSQQPKSQQCHQSQNSPSSIKQHQRSLSCVEIPFKQLETVKTNKQETSQKIVDSKNKTIRLSSRDFANVVCQNSLNVIIDVRSKEQYKISHIVGAQSVDVQQLQRVRQPETSLQLFEQGDNNNKLLDLIYRTRDKLIIYGAEDIDDRNQLVIEQIFKQNIKNLYLCILIDNFSVIQANYSFLIQHKTYQAKVKQVLQDIPNEIIPSLYLGMLKGNIFIEKILNEMKIDHVINCASNITYENKHITFDNLKMADNERCQAPLEEAFEIIDNALSSGKRVFVNCQMGISRSATIVSAYLIRKFKLRAIDALFVIKAQRPCIDPNDGFLQQLYKWELETFNINNKKEKELSIQQNDKTDTNMNNLNVSDNQSEYISSISQILSQMSQLQSQSQYQITSFSSIKSEQVIDQHQQLSKDQQNSINISIQPQKHKSLANFTNLKEDKCAQDNNKNYSQKLAQQSKLRQCTQNDDQQVNKKELDQSQQLNENQQLDEFDEEQMLDYAIKLSQQDDAVQQQNILKNFQQQPILTQQEQQNGLIDVNLDSNSNDNENDNEELIIEHPVSPLLLQSSFQYLEPLRYLFQKQSLEKQQSEKQQSEKQSLKTDSQLNSEFDEQIIQISKVVSLFTQIPIDNYEHEYNKLFIRMKHAMNKVNKEMDKSEKQEK